MARRLDKGRSPRFRLTKPLTFPILTVHLDHPNSADHSRLTVKPSNRAEYSIGAAIMTAFALFITVVSALKTVGHSVGHFSYDPINEYAPQYWGKIAPKCSSVTRQSPINILPNRVKYGQVFSVHESCDQALIDGKLVNNGHAASASLDPGCTLTVKNVPGYNDATFRLASFHFHFGHNNHVGSEHRIDGHAFPSEMHLVHINTKYATITEALTKSDGLAVVGVFLTVGSHSNPILGQVMDHMPDVKIAEQTSYVSVNVLDLLPSLTKMYNYAGSLTTPPCSEVVQWFIANDHLKITIDQLAMLRSLHTGAAGSPLIAQHGNYRPLQPDNRKTVFANF